MKDIPKVYSYARFSSTVQGKGISIERQVKRAEEWCAEHGYVLDQVHTDKGKSGFHGDHISSGALGRFLSDVHEGKIPPNSILLIEQLDRLTRQNLHEAQGILHQILGAGIRIITLGDGREYTKHQGVGDVIGMIVNLEASHVESKRKSDRSTKNWDKLQEKALAGKIVTKRHPSWLKIVGDRFEIIPERAKVIQQMFKWASEGMGTMAIASSLSKKGMNPWVRAKDWNNGTVYDMITSTRVIGELTLKRKGYDKPVIIPNYFPAIIDVGLFQIVQQNLRARTTNGRHPRAGRAGMYRNLISDLGRCGYCGGAFSFADWGKAKKENRYRLVCRSAKKGLTCKYHAFRYREVEQALLQFCAEVDVLKVVEVNGVNAELDLARERLQEVNGRIAVVDAKIDGAVATIDAMNVANMIQHLAKHLDDLGIEKNELEDTKQALQNEVERLSRSGSNLQIHMETIKSLSERMANNDEPETVEVRRKLRFEFSQAIEEIVFFPAGLQGRTIELVNGTLEVVDCKPGLTPEQEVQLAALLDDGEDHSRARGRIIRGQRRWFKAYKASTTGKDKAVFLVRFRNGHCRAFQWNADGKAFEQVQELTATEYTTPLLKVTYTDGDFILS